VAAPADTPEPQLSNVPLAQPEIAFAAEAAARPPEPERPFPATRRAIFFDVENTSRVQHIARVIDYLAVDRLGRRTDFVAVGNWRVIGHDTARLLAGHGAQLLHSAPSTGVKDWSDLRIAVAAGVWLGTARPGDILEIITDDRAFDAVGDVATSLGIAFRRLSYRGLTGLPREAVPAPAPVAAVEPLVESAGGGASRYRRGRRGGRGRREAAPAVHAVPQPAARQVVAEAHTAPHDELLGVARDLIQASPGGAVTLDALANALKSRGFSRPPGSPRLITRLRRLRELSVSRSGHITLVDASGAAAPVLPVETPAAAPAAVEAAAPEPERAPAPSPPPAPAAPPPPAPAAEPSPAGIVDDRTFEERRADVEAALRAGQIISQPRDAQPRDAQPRDAQPRDAQPRDAQPRDAQPRDPGRDSRREPAPGGGPDGGQRRRRSRRGGRGRRRHGAPAAG
jgi:hypothetical protein